MKNSMKSLTLSSLLFASLTVFSHTASATETTNHTNLRPADTLISWYESASEKVKSAFSQWQGTRYRLGGNSKSGIDCSAFVQHTMSSSFNIQLPRTTATQKHVGTAISKADLRPGDLVFFRNNKHVGVYVGDGKFVHSSTKKGVTMDSLSSNYYMKTFTQARRVVNE